MTEGRKETPTKDSLEHVGDSLPADPVHHEHLDHPHGLLHPRPALGIGDIEGVAHNLEIFVEVGLGKEWARGRNGAVDLKCDLLPLFSKMYFL